MASKTETRFQKFVFEKMGKFTKSSIKRTVDVDALSNLKLFGQRLDQKTFASYF